MTEKEKQARQDIAHKIADACFEGLEKGFEPYEILGILESNKMAVNSLVEKRNRERDESET